MPARRGGTLDSRPIRRGFTLVEMLVAMAITLVMMGAVVTLFANVSDSVRNRRAVIEMSGQMRHVRNLLQRDLQGATCPGLTWQRPEHNRGYIEIIEGGYRDSYPSMLTDGIDDPAIFNAELDPQLSSVPRNNVVPDYNGNNEVDDSDRREHLKRWNSFVVREDPLGDESNNTNPIVATANGLGDYDDILMLTVRNEHEPFVGRAPSGVRTDDTSTFAQPFGGTPGWTSQSIESPLAEVVWFAIENPMDSSGGYFGEPGMRTIYRRTLLIAPWLNPYGISSGNFRDRFQINGSGPTFRAEPGLMRILPQDASVAQAIAALIAFQDRYDLSVRLEFDARLGNSPGRWKIVANTLGDLTKRENRFEHFGFRPGSTQVRQYPFAAVSTGSGYSGTSEDVLFVPDMEITPFPTQSAEATAIMLDVPILGNIVSNYTIVTANLDNLSRRYLARPFAYVDDDDATTPATARAILNEVGEVVAVVRGLAPLWGSRRGEDVMLTNALAFDLRVYDPGAPLFGLREEPGSSSNQSLLAVLDPNDPIWWRAYQHGDNMECAGQASDVTLTTSQRVGSSADTYPFVGQGAYVDLGYGYQALRVPQDMPPPLFAPSFSSAIDPWFFTPRALSDVYGNQLAPGYAVYDTWSFHYENNGLNEDRLRYDGSAWIPVDDLVDEGTNGFDDVGSYSDGFLPSTNNPRLGVDDIGERETAPPYDHPLRGVQVILRAYEPDSRQPRQVSVKQHFLPE